MVFVVGAPASGLGRMARALHHPPQSAFVRGWPLGDILSHLWEATEARVRRPGVPWKRPEPPEWVDASVAEFGRLLIGARTGEVAVRGVAHPSLARHLPAMQRWFPQAVFLHLVRDALVVPGGRVLPDEPRAAARAGLAWGERWAAHVGVACGAGLPLLHHERCSADTLEALAQQWGISAGSWPLPHAPERRLAGPAAEGLACSAAAQLMEELGYALPALGALAHSMPVLIAARARGMIGSGRAGDAIGLLSGAGTHPQLLAVLGEALQSVGDEDAAVEAWSAAVAQAGAPREAWLGLLGLPERPESVPAAAAGRTASDLVVRAATARWMVARGMDHEAAEAVAGVHGTRWYLPGTLS